MPYEVVTIGDPAPAATNALPRVSLTATGVVALGTPVLAAALYAVPAYRKWEAGLSAGARVAMSLVSSALYLVAIGFAQAYDERTTPSLPPPPTSPPNNVVV